MATLNLSTQRVVSTRCSVQTARRTYAALVSNRVSRSIIIDGQRIFGYSRQGVHIAAAQVMRIAHEVQRDFEHGC